MRIKFFNLNNDKVKEWLVETFEVAKREVFITCKDTEVRLVQNLKINGGN